MRSRSRLVKKRKPLSLFSKPRRRSWQSLSRSRNANRGFTLIVVVFIGIMLVGLLTAYMLLSKGENTTAASSNDSSSGFYAAESGLNLRAKTIIDRFQNRGRPTGTSPTSIDACTNASSGDDGTVDFACQSYKMSKSLDGIDRNAVTYMVETTQFTGTGANRTPIMKTIPPDEPFAGLNAQENSYQLNSVGRKMTEPTPQTEAVLTMDLKSRVVPMFQFAAFYDKDLEILPSPVMTLAGPVHTNGDLYLGGSNTLTLQGQVTVGGKRNASDTVTGGIYNRRKDDDDVTFADGKVRVNNASSTPVNLLSGATGSTSQTTDRLNDNDANRDRIKTTWSNRIVVPSPKLQMPDAGFLSTSGEYFTKGDLRISYTPNITGTTAAVVRQSVPMTVAKVTAGTPSALNEGQLRSLLQPVLGSSAISVAKSTVGADLSSTSSTNNPTWVELTATFTTAQQTLINNLTVAQKASLIDKLNTALSSGINNIPLAYMQSINFKQSNLTSIPRINPANANTANSTLGTLTAGVDFALFRASDSGGSGTIMGDSAFASLSSDDQNSLKSALRALSPNQFYGLILRNLNATQKGQIVRGLQTAILSQSTPLTFSLTNDALNRTGLATLDSAYSGGNTYSSTGSSYLDRLMAGSDFSSFTDLEKTAIKTALRSLTPAQIAAMLGRAWFPAAFMDIGSSNPTAYYSDREAKETRLLQINLRSLIIWNRDGVYLNYSSGAVSDDATTQMTYITNNTLPTANQLMFNLAAADSGAPANSFQRLGYAGSDTTDGGYVVHMTIDTAATAYPTGAGTTASPGNSPYGFIISQGNDLFGLSSTTTTPDPTGVTFASDQAMYVQGDLNSINKQPAATLSDTLNVLSNACTTPDIRISKPSGSNCNGVGATLTQAATSASTTLRVLNVQNFAVNDQVTVGNDATNNRISAIDAANSTITLSAALGTDQTIGSPVVKKANAITTTVNAGFLAGTDETNSSVTSGYNGGLENYPRFSENWSGQTLNYAGSFVSLGIPQKVRGRWGAQAYSPPARNWGFDVSFRDVNKLPPLDPRFVYLKQDTFVRSFPE